MGSKAFFLTLQAAKRNFAEIHADGGITLKIRVQCAYSWLDSKGQINQSFNCEIRLYETALLILPQKNKPIPCLSTVMSPNPAK